VGAVEDLVEDGAAVGPRLSAHGATQRRALFYSAR
jgi:hypothetical protein